MILRLSGAVLALSLLGACDQPSSEQPAQSQRIAIAEARRAQLRPIEVPDTSEARWAVDEGGQAIRFGNAGEAPLLTLDCRLGEEPPQMRIIRHVQAQPGEGALFPVIGNGMRSRFLVDAKLEDGEWRWEGTVPASDPMLDVFTGPRQLTATLPGGGMLEIGGSRIPGEFITWCRAGHDVMEAEAEEQEDAGNQPQGEPVN